MVKYAQGVEGILPEPAELSDRLAAVLQEGMAWLATVPEYNANVPESDGKWSAKQVIGHLIDSSVNNLARIVRLQIEDDPGFSGYEQNAWVRVQHYELRDWSGVLALWFALNEHLMGMIGHIERERMAHTGIVEGDRVTLGFLIEDYIAHMVHHLTAMRPWLGAGNESAP
jgi:hypothetical protein